jgi:hypothetical protein
MMTNHPADDGESFVIPARTLRGSRQDMLQDIDQAIVGLLALRQLIGSGGVPHPTIPLRRAGRSALNRAWEWLRLLPAKPNVRQVHRGKPAVS